MDERGVYSKKWIFRNVFSRGKSTFLQLEIGLFFNLLVFVELGVEAELLFGRFATALGGAF